MWRADHSFISLLHNNTWPSEHMISPSAEFDPVIGGEVCPQVCHKCVFVITQRELLPASMAIDRKLQHYNHLYLSILILYVQNKENWSGVFLCDILYGGMMERFELSYVWLIPRLFCVTRFYLVLHKFWSNKKKSNYVHCVHDFNCNHLTAVFDAVVKYSINTHL